MKNVGLLIRFSGRARFQFFNSFVLKPNVCESAGEGLKTSYFKPISLKPNLK